MHAFKCDINFATVMAINFTKKKKTCNEMCIVIKTAHKSNQATAVFDLISESRNFCYT